MKLKHERSTRWSHRLSLPSTTSTLPAIRCLFRAVPCRRCIHSVTVASRALLAGESVDEVAFLLGHRDGTVTRTVYVREVADARRHLTRRSRLTAEFGAALAVALDSRPASRPGRVDS